MLGLKKKKISTFDPALLDKLEIHSISTGITNTRQILECGQWNLDLKLESSAAQKDSEGGRRSLELSTNAWPSHHFKGVFVYVDNICLHANAEKPLTNILQAYPW